MRERDNADMERLYIAVLGDLTPGLATAQAVHAAFEFAARHPEITAAWLRDSKYLVILAVPDEVKLIRLASSAVAAEIAVETWHEPDLGDRTTAVALAPGRATQTLCAQYPLLGRRPMALTG